jgi:tetrahydromethanopterin S-methyltransferase subunit B
MTQVDIEEYEMFKNVKKLLPVIGVIWTIFCVVATTTWVAKDKYDSLATKEDVKIVVMDAVKSALAETVEPLVKRVDSIERSNKPVVSVSPKRKQNSKIFGYMEQKVNGMIVTIPVYR